MGDCNISENLMADYSYKMIAGHIVIEVGAGTLVGPCPLPV